MRTIFISILALLVACPGNGALAMSSSNYAIPFDDVAGGGGDTSSSANFMMRDTLGQPAIGSGASTNYGAEQGYRTAISNPVLSVAFVDGLGVILTSPPTVSFASLLAGATVANGVLAPAAAHLRVTNTRSIAPWSLAIAATLGPTALWNSGSGATMDFNQPGSASLTINPAAASITPVSSPCTNAGLTLGSEATFNQGVVDSITLLTAGAGAMTQCSWDTTGINMAQTIPAAQTPGSYSISMTVTVS
jgi:hypothetical protein